MKCASADGLSPTAYGSVMKSLEANAFRETAIGHEPSATGKQKKQTIDYVESKI